MILRINETPVDFTLEREKTFADLYLSLDAWARSQQLELFSVLADGRSLAPDDAVGLETLKTVDVEAIPKGSGTLARLALVTRFFTLAAQADGPSAELKEQYSAIRGIVPTLLSPVTHRLADAWDLLEGDWSQPGISDAAARVAREAAALHRELSDPRAALAEALDQLESALPGEELAQLFQKGDDKEGFERILALFTAFENLTRRAELALETAKADTTAWNAFQEDLRPFLGEARDALEAADQILLTDLLEYEIVPRLSAVRESLSSGT